MGHLQAPLHWEFCPVPMSYRKDLETKSRSLL